MSETAERLKDQLGRLSIDDRAALARFLIESLDAQTDPNAEAAWDAELQRRLSEIEAGTANGIPADQVFDDLRRKYS